MSFTDMKMGQGSVTIHRLQTGAGTRLRTIRVQALADAPEAFGTTLEEAEAESDQSWERQLEELATFVAIHDGVDVGLARGARHDERNDTGYLISMWGAPDVRRQGVAGMLIDAVVAWARAEGFQRLLLDVGENNLPARALYAQKGFVPNGTFGALPPPREHLREIQLELGL